jgi:hypothetical protein
MKNVKLTPTLTLLSAHFNVAMKITIESGSNNDFNCHIKDYTFEKCGSKCVAFLKSNISMLGEKIHVNLYILKNINNYLILS